MVLLRWNIYLRFFNLKIKENLRRVKGMNEFYILSNGVEETCKLLNKGEYTLATTKLKDLIISINSFIKELNSTEEGLGSQTYQDCQQIRRILMLAKDNVNNFNLYSRKMNVALMSLSDKLKKLGEIQEKVNNCKNI